VAEAILQLGEALGVDRLVDRLKQSAPAERWARAAWRGLLEDLDDLRRSAARRAFEDFPAHSEPDAVLAFLVGRSRPVGEVTRLLRDIDNEPNPSLDAVAVATRAVRRAIG
jgi:NAD-specific glutamate dehydrogenase